MTRSSDGVAIREALATDWLAVARLLAELGRPDVLDEPDESSHERHYQDYLAREDTVGLVAMADGVVVGFVDVEFRRRLNFEEPQAWIPDLVVAEAARGRGAGVALLARAEELARQRGCFGLSLESANWREASHAFYLHTGWSDTGKSFTKSLSGKQWPPAPR